MALTATASKKSRSNRGRIWSRIHYLSRLAGLTGLLALGSGLVLAHLENQLHSDLLPQLFKLEGTPTTWLISLGIALIVPALCIEVLLLLFLTAGRRNIASFNACIQILLATLLLIGINIWSAGIGISLPGQEYTLPPHFARFDLTREKTFTLPQEIQKKFANLQGETTVVIYLRHRIVSSQTALPDQYDVAAERKVIEKVKDLVEQLRDLGSRFHVEYLDTESEGYQEQLEKLTKKLPNLKKAIDRAPENSLFFCDSNRTDGNGAVQQLSFNDFLRLDKTSSQEASGGKGNLVLSKGGVEPIVKRIINLEQRRPRVGVLVIHEALTTEGSLEFYSLAGARKALEEQGYEVRDLVLKRESQSADGRSPFEPAVDPLEDSKLDRLRDEREQLQREIDDLNDEIKICMDLVGLLPSGSLAEINKRLRLFRLVMPSDEARPAVKRLMEEQLALNNQQVLDRQSQLNEIDRELGGLNLDQIQERRRITDLKAKLEEQLSDCDLLLIPRITTDNDGNLVVPPSLHDLDKRQVEAIKNFLRNGKPMLFAFGTINRPTGPAETPDVLENLLSEIGLRMGKRTVLLDVEKRTFTGEPPNPFRSRPLRIPELELTGSTSALLADRRDSNLQRQSLAPQDLFQAGAWFSSRVNGPWASIPIPVLENHQANRRINPVRESLYWNGRSSANPLSIKVRKPRPVDIDPKVASRLDYEPVFLVTAAASWNDENPFPSRGRPVPRFQRSTGFDPDAGTIDEKRQGPFPIGVAYEAEIPASWQESESEAPRMARLIAIGHGGIFVGTNLSPGPQRLLLDSCNWLLGRQDRLARQTDSWSYPRVSMTPYQQSVWLWACGLGLPMLFFYFGLVVLLARRVR